MLSTIQNSFAAGEMSPNLFGRTDLKKYHSGASTMRNFWVNYRGGASSRGGYAYVGTCKQTAINRANSTDWAPRDIPFQFNINQGYALEFGDQYMRIKTNGGYVVEQPKMISGISNGNPAVINIPAHGYVAGDWVFISSVLGMKDFNGLDWIVTTVPDADHVTVTNLFGSLVNSTLFNSYISGGTAQRVYTVVAPYAAVDLPYLKFIQSADTMSLVCVNQVTLTEYPPYDLVRNGITNWTFTKTSFSAVIAAPTGVTAKAFNSTTLSTYYSYVVTAIDKKTGDESVASQPALVQNNDIAVNMGSNTITWSPVTGAKCYYIYEAVPSFDAPVASGTSFGYVGYAFGTSFTDTNIQADFTKTPPTHNDPFAEGTITAVTVTAGGSNLSPLGVGYVVTTSTGSGFTGSPIVSGGAFTGFVIENGGGGYMAGDTIAINTNANGKYTFTTNPAAGNTIVLNGVTWHFNTTKGATTSVIGADVQTTISTLVTDLNASTNASIDVASYYFSGLDLLVVYKAPGTGGNAYTLAAGTYGGAVSNATLQGGSTSGVATADLVIGKEIGTFPSVVTYFQQRRGYANTTNQPDTYFFSHPGSYKNFDSAIPTISSDAVIGTPWAQQVNGIQFLQPMPTGLITLTGNGAWLLSGGSQTAFTPDSQTASAQAYNGCSPLVPPIVIDYDILYVQSKGSTVRDLAFNFYVGVYTGQDKTTLCDHLFNYFQITQWAYAAEPYKIIWAVRNDGSLLSLTWLKDQDVYGWAHHDTNGAFVGVCSITEPPVDAIYVIVKRFVNGQWMYYSERMDNRNWQNPEDCFCVDAGLAWPMAFPNATLTPGAVVGTGNISSVKVIAGGFGYTAPTVVAIDADGNGTGATFNVTLSSGAITAITPILQGAGFAPGSASLVITDTTGGGAIAQPTVTNIVAFNASNPVFFAGDVGSVIRIGNNNFDNLNPGIVVDGGGKAIITSFISATQVMANIVEPITAIIPNSSNDQPVPAIPAQWSLSVPTNVVTGLNHLEGMTVAILGDGSVIPNQVVVGGMITLPEKCSAITIGLPYVCQLQTMYLDPEGQANVQGDRKNISSVIVRVEGSRGIAVGSNQPDQSTQPNNAPVTWSHLIPVKQRTAAVDAGSAIPLFTGDVYVNIPSDWAVQGQVAVEQVYPLPANILAVICRFNLGDTRNP